MFYAFSSTILSCVYLYSIYPCFCRVYCLPAICVFLICTLPHRLCWLVWGGGQLTLRSHVWTRGRVAQQGGDWWEGGSFKRTPMYSFVYYHF